VTERVADHWDEADRVFDRALELAPDDRGPWLDEACAGNAGLRTQIEALLLADAAAGRFLELDALRLAAPSLLGPEAEPAVGRPIGPYRVMRELARGGMGVVYLAERADGQFEQRVALKLIKRGMDSDEIYRRFLAERQILARLNHPHIARLLDGGVSAEGQPYFALEYIEGTTIIAHCETRRLDVDERLRLFLDVCDAVRYAHQNLVVHRDLKPSNILVTADGEVKLLDFGIAKLLGQEAGSETGLTETGLRVMTPEYAAPEQVAGDPVTTATDVYALGAVLYELLTWHRAHRLDRRTPAEIVRVVCEVEPEPPSAVAPGAYRRRLRGDLDTIALTALKKEPDRRYPTVEQLASDVRRHLDGLPVTARPDTWRYRAAKFVGRHRIGVAAGTAVVLSLVAGLAGTIWQARVAADRAWVASAEAAKERAVRDFILRLFQASAPGQSLGKDMTARELLDRGRRDLDTALAAQPAVRSELLSVVANVYAALGLAPQADTLFSQAVALTRTLPGNADVELAGVLTGWAANLIVQSKFDRAEPLLQEAIDRLRRRDPGDPRLEEPLRALGRIQTYTGNHARASTLLREVLAIALRHHGAQSWQVAEASDVLGYELLRQGNLPAADSLIGAALAIWRRLLQPDHPSLLWTLSNLAAVRRAQGNDAEAERLLKDVVAGQRRIYPNGHSELAHSLMELGMLLEAEGHYAEAESLTAPAVAVHRRLLGPDNDHAAMLLQNLAGFRYHLGKFEAAERDLREVIDIWRRTLGAGHRRTLSSIDELGVYVREQGRYDEAESLAREALAGRRKALGDSHADIARSLRNIGIVKRLKGEPAEAEPALREALAIARKALPAGPAVIVGVLAELGGVLNDLGRPTEAEPLLREALAASTKNPASTPYEASATQRGLGYSLTLQGRYAEAEALLLEVYRDLGAGRDYWSGKERGETLRRLVGLYSREGRPVEAAKYRRLLSAAAGN
jgi:tetratricopeptide (TPR) repeat protein/predicted Ser/Thr protein kinase